jgi:Family of unknown function (DUF6519)
MKGDFSRIPFDPTKHYVGVLHQQGRVWLDSDWNEEVFERLALWRQELKDVIGACGVPSANSFQLSPGADPNALDNFQISAGRAYVDGHLAQLETNTGYLNQPDYLDPLRLPIPTDGTTLTALIYLEVWQRLVTYLEDPSIREVALGGPDTSARVKTVTQVKAAVIPNGVTTCQQASAFLPTSGSGTLTTLQPTANQPQTLCQLPDPANFTGRENHLFRVQVHDGGDVSGGGAGGAFAIPLGANVAAGATAITTGTPLTSAQASAALRSGWLTISDNTGNSERVSLAGITTTGTLNLTQGLVNAYTTANQASVTGGLARFKWSRDNASFAVAVTAVKADRVTLTLASLGRDLATTLRQGDLVEISDDASELGPARGHLTYLKADPDPDLFTTVLADPLPASFAMTGEQSVRHLVLRRWDGVGDAAATYGDASTPGMNLGDGVHVQFAGLDLRPGDYWQFAVRSADGSVEALTNAPPQGIKRCWCPLAIVTWGPVPQTSPPSSPPAGVAMTIVQDCRKIFPQLVNFPQAEKGFHVNSVFTVDANAAQTVLANDTNVQINSFGGIDILFDTPPDPASISRPTFYLSAEYPVQASSQGAGAYFPINLAGSLTVNGTTISWRPPAQTQSLLTDLIAATQNDPHNGVLVHITLKGHFIWALGDRNTFLDGDVYGQGLGGSNNIALKLPSGDNRRGGDFHMWFWIVAAPSFASQIQAVPSQIYVGDSTTFTVTFSAAAPAGSAAAAITSSAANVAAVPATVAVPTGATAITFAVKGAAIGATTVSAAFGGQTVATTLAVSPPPVLTGQVGINPPAIFVGDSANGSITLTGPAPSTGTVIALASTNPAVATVPGSVTVPAGSTTASFLIHGAAAGQATIVANLAGVSVSGLITVRIRPKIKEKEKDNLVDKVQVREEKGVVLEKKNLLVERKLLEAASRPAAGFDPLATGISGGTARSFIQPDERPAVEEHVLNASHPEAVSRNP